jgi:hypothetical protein
MRALRREAPLILLILYGSTFAYAAFGRGVPAFDDHPGQLFRLWHALDRSMPSLLWTADWNPDWWGGYPELQFYPPGFALLGAAVRALLLWRPSVETVYRLLCAVVFLAPGLTTYALLVRVVGNRWLALPGAFLALTLSADLRGGVEAGLRWGTLTTRLGLAWLPLLALALRPWVEGGRLPRWAPPLAALAILSHPSTLPSVAALLGLATALALLGRPERRTLWQAGATVSLALALTASWSLPFAIRQSWVVPLAWGDLSLGFPADLPGRPVLLALGMIALTAWVAVGIRRHPFDALLAALPLVLGALFLADVWLFPQGWLQIEPQRLLDGVVQASLWAGGLGAGVIVDRLLPARADPRSRPLVALVAIGLAIALPDGDARPPTLAVWPTAAEWPTLDDVSGRHHLDRLWSALRGGTDRVLFLTSSLKLDRNPAWYAPHSHIPSLTPLRAGREIVNGTFTHPSPMAARFYSGQAVPPTRIVTLVERLDGQRLLGEPWERLSASTFDRFARKLRVGTVVVPTGDAARARFLAPEYAPAGEAAGYALFERRERPWPRVERITWRRYRVLVSPTGGVWIPTGIAAYPLWRVKSAAGRLEMRVDDWGLLEFRVPVDLFEAELVYAEGWLEWTALALFAIGGGAWIVWASRARAPAAKAPAAKARVRRGGRS